MDDLLADIRSGIEGWNDELFTRHARDLFAHQYTNIEPYRRFCDGRAVTPDSLDDWLDIPAVPTDVFKRVRLSATDEPIRTFRTSGTTVGERGEHHFDTLDYYRAAIAAPFKRYCMPDRDRMPMLILAPSPGDLPDSSLSFMLGELVGDFGQLMWSGFYVGHDDEENALAFDWEGFVETLALLVDRDAPVMLLGTAFAFVEFFDEVGLDFELPAGSRLMETGGLKGKSREVTKQELYDGFAEHFGLPATHCIGEYSMTELSSQAYTDSLALDRPWDEARFRVPPYVRVIAVDPLELTPLPAGERGLLRWYDLANVHSVLAVQTSDLGVVDDDGGFQLFGRAKGSQLRGCSLTVEEIAENA